MQVMVDHAGVCGYAELGHMPQPETDFLPV
jgi:hypothetical protein